MHDDDRPIGRKLTRREILERLGASSAALLLTACGAGSSGSGASDVSNLDCVARPAQTEGPLFVDDMLNRSDIRSDPSTGAVSAGVPLALTLLVSQLGSDSCTPLSGVQVDIWQCDADGVYSDTNDLGMNTVGQKFLRGHQMTDASGKVVFTTIYPGWYEDRTVHIHFKIRTADGYDFTSQLYFDDNLSDTVLSQSPYDARGDRNLRNSDDGIFREGGNELILNLSETDEGYAATYSVGLDLS